MTMFRNQIHSARSAYRQVRYPGDLAEIVLPPQARAFHRIWPMVAVRVGLAAAAALVFFAWARVVQHHVEGAASASWVQTVRGEMGQLTRLQPGEKSVSAQSLTLSSLNMLGQPQESGLFYEVARPLASSAKFVGAVGKDLIHRADALVHMG